MRLIIITPPDPFPDEPDLVSRILGRLPAVLHLRKPGQSGQQIADTLDRVSTALHPRIMVHGHPELLQRFELKGVHFTENARICQLAQIQQLRTQRPDISISSAFHRIQDIPESGETFDYLFLSPIFDSISKAGYRAAFDYPTLRPFLSQTELAVIALGGVDDQRLADVARLGFKGAAVLGAVWQSPDPVKAAERLWAICSGL